MHCACTFSLRKALGACKGNLLWRGVIRVLLQSLHLEIRFIYSRNPSSAFVLYWYFVYFFSMLSNFSCEMFAHLCILNTTEGGRCSKQKRLRPIKDLFTWSESESKKDQRLNGFKIMRCLVTAGIPFSALCWSPLWRHFRYDVTCIFGSCTKYQPRTLDGCPLYTENFPLRYFLMSSHLVYLHGNCK